MIRFDKNIPNQQIALLPLSQNTSACCDSFRMSAILLLHVSLECLDKRISKAQNRITSHHHDDECVQKYY